ncbi:MAG: ATP-binding protein [Planctomycetia bacterium]|nr:ATP-binding protein [Planctomycetia bacterium]
MIDRTDYMKQLAATVRRSPVTALVGPRQCGKTTLVRELASSRKSTHFDLESAPDRQRLQNPELMLGSLKALVVLDEIQSMPELFNVLRVLVDRPKSTTRFLVLGSASPALIKGVSETLAGRIQFVELAGFDLRETGTNSLDALWLRGGFPRSFLAKSDSDSAAWREGFIQTFLERDIPQLGITLAAPAMRRFWTMLAHYHGQIWNASELARSMSLSDKTVRAWLDILTGTFMVRQLQPWFVNVGKRQVKSPKVYVRDTGLLHSLFNLTDRHALLGHPRVGASWEGFVLEQVLRAIRPDEAYYWATHNGVELDLLFQHRGRSYGVEIKFNEAPAATKSMRIAIDDLGLKHLWIIYPGTERFPIDKHISAWPLRDVAELRGELR